MIERERERICAIVNDYYTTHYGHAVDVDSSCKIIDSFDEDDRIVDGWINTSINNMIMYYSAECNDDCIR
jgi:hypothetical protein